MPPLKAKPPATSRNRGASADDEVGRPAPVGEGDDEAQQIEGRAAAPTASGTATMSVVRWVVVDSISPEGIAASATQWSSRRHDGAGPAASGIASTAAAGTVSAQATTISTSRA